VPPRHAYWTIIYANQPTAFRAATPDELLPTLRQLQSKHPDAVMMWFARGRLWKSPEESREALARRRARVRHEDRSNERRGREWRPGGAHRDPRDRFKVPRDVKRKRFAARLRTTNNPPRPRKKKDEHE
jgi:hypothetical protein